MITLLYYKPSCPFCKKVLSHLDTLGLSIPLKNIAEDPKVREELLHLGGKAQVPCLFIDGKPLYESDDIIDWINENREEL
jgi:glutaredoxin